MSINHSLATNQKEKLGKGVYTLFSITSKDESFKPLIGFSLHRYHHHLDNYVRSNRRSILTYQDAQVKFTQLSLNFLFRFFLLQNEKLSLDIGPNFSIHQGYISGKQIVRSDFNPPSESNVSGKELFSEGQIGIMAKVNYKLKEFDETKLSIYNELLVNREIDNFQFVLYSAGLALRF